MKKNSTFYGTIIVDKDQVTVDSYDTGAAPIIDGSISVTGWTGLGGNIYSKVIVFNYLNNEGLGNISEDGVMLTPQGWATDYTTSMAGKPDGSYTFDWTNRVMYIKTASAPNTKTYRVSFELFGVKFKDGVNNGVVKNIDIKRFSLNGVEFMNCDGCQAINLNISNGGGAVVAVQRVAGFDYMYAGNGIEFDHSSTNGLIDGSTITSMFDSCLSPQTYVSNRFSSNQTFRNLTLSKCGFAGIEISILSNGGNTGSSISNITVSNVTMTDMGKGWSGKRYGTEGYGIRIAADAGAGSISNTVITNVNISNSINHAIHIVGETGVTTISKSKFTSNGGMGVSVTEATYTSPKLKIDTSVFAKNGDAGVSYHCVNCQGINLFNNTFVDNTTFNLAIWAQATEAKIQNNIFYSTSPIAQFYSFNAALRGNVTVDNNCYKEGINMYAYNNVTYHTIATFNATNTALDNNSTAIITAGFTNTASEDYSLTSASDCKASGALILGISSDIDGKPFSNPPSAGAYQF